MKKKKTAKNVYQQYEEHTEAIAAPIAGQFGIRIYDVEYVREGDEYFLNVYIDKDGGVNINDCENVSRLLSDALDKDDPIPDAYTLIVSSPGLGRALTKDRHLQQSIGQDVEIHLYKPHAENGQKDIRGELLEFDDSRLVLAADLPVPAKGKGKGKKKESAKNSVKKASAEEAAAEITAEIEETMGVTDNAPAGTVGIQDAPENAPADTAGNRDASENAPAGADDIVAAQIQYAAQSGRQRLTVERKEIASIRLAFDF